MSFKKYSLISKCFVTVDESLQTFLIGQTILFSPRQISMASAPSQAAIDSFISAPCRSTKTKTPFVSSSRPLGLSSGFLLGSLLRFCNSLLSMLISTLTLPSLNQKHLPTSTLTLSLSSVTALGSFESTPTSTVIRSSLLVDDWDEAVEAWLKKACS